MPRNAGTSGISNSNNPLALGSHSRWPGVPSLIMIRRASAISLLAFSSFTAAGCGHDDLSDLINEGSTGGSGGSSAPGKTLEWSASAPAAGDDCVAAHTYALPDWLKLTSPSSGKTSQTSASTLCAGFGPDAPRARNVSEGAAAEAWGLSIESARTNRVTDSDAWKGTSWIPFQMTQSGSNEPDPTGGMAATMFASKGVQASTYHVKINGQSVSAWLRGGPTGSAPYAHFRHFGELGAPYVDVDGTTWKRYAFAHAANTDGEVALETRAIPLPAKEITVPTDILAFGAQVEPDGAYPSSYIPTKSTAVTREAEILFCPRPEALAPGGALHVELRVAPNFAHDEQGAEEHNLLFFDDKNRLFLRKSDHKVIFRVGGVDVATEALAFGRDQELTITAKSTPGGEMSLTVAGATSGDGTITGGPGAAIPAPTSGVVTILGGPAGAEECADLRSIKFIGGG